MTQDSLGQGAVRRAPKPGEASPEGSTRDHLVVDDRYAEILAEDLGVDPELAMKAFLGVDRKRALNVVAWALLRSDDPDQRGRMIQAWARKRKAGAWSLRPRRYVAERPERDGDDDGRNRYLEAARGLALAWSEHPELLAEALVKLEEATRNGGR